MKIELKDLQKVKACQTSMVKFNNTFKDGVIIPDEFNEIKVYDYCLYDDICWLIPHLKLTVDVVYNFYKTIFKDGLKIEEINSSGKYQYKYNDIGLMTEQINPNDDKIQWKYNDLGLKIEEIDSFGNKIRWKYNDKGLMIEQIDSDGDKTQYKYNEQELMIEEIDFYGDSYFYNEKYENDKIEFI